MATRRFARPEKQDPASAPEPNREDKFDQDEADALAHEVLVHLAGGRTRSAVELVTELAVTYDDLADVLRRLLDDRLVRLSYEAAGERFYALEEGGVTALNNGGIEEQEAPADEPATPAG